MAVDAVLKVIDPLTAENVDLKNIKVVKKVGGTIDDSELATGLIFTQGVAKAAGGPSSIKAAKIALVQFCLSAPKTDIENEIIVSDHDQLDRILREEKKYIVGLCKVIQKAGCNVILVQKSILRDAISDLALHFLAKMKIMVIKNIEREDISFISKTLGCKPIASIDSFLPDKLGVADLVQEEGMGNSKIVRVTGIPPQPFQTCTVLLRASNAFVLDEAERSFHDALCVVRSLVKRKSTIVGGGSPEIEMSIQLAKYAQTLEGAESLCVKAFAEALEIIPYTLAENAGLHPMKTVTELRNMHAAGHIHTGINVRRGNVTSLLEENVIQPLLVTSSSLNLATETVRMILKIDDILIKSR
jgi:T-complex protein 1 subunit delta